jgi:ABC-type glycerol-3-phosphate transport system permease component
MTASVQTNTYRRAPSTVWKFRLTAIVVWVALVILVVLSLYPFVMMFVNSFKTDSEILTNPSGLPEKWTFASYASVFFERGGLLRNFVNGLIIAVTSTVTAVVMTSMAAFAFSKYKFKGRDAIFTMLMLTLMVPPQITIPPLYIMFAKLGMLNTLEVQILPTITSVFGLFMVRQYMMSIPNEIIEAARIDGAGHWQTFWYVMLPVSWPILGAFAILHFLATWNNYLWPLIVANDPAVQPIMVTLPNLTDSNLGFLPVWGTIMAGCVLATLPILIVFIAFQERFMASATVGAVKT